MELVFSKWVFAFSLFCWLFFSVAFSGLDEDSKVRGVNLGGWLVLEGWIKPSLFEGIPNADMLDGTQVSFKSVKLQKYVCAENGGGMDISVNRDSASSWETFTLWRVTESEFQFRTTQGQFLTSYGNGGTVSATAKSASSTEAFQVERNNNGRVHIKTKGGAYLQATIDNRLTADYPGNPGWDDNAATFEMSIVANNLHGDYQFANGYGYSKAKEVLETHRRTFINATDFEFLHRNGMNTVRIPVGWWIAYDPNPPAPFIGGTLEALDNAFSWAQAYKIKCIIDLHAAPGSQNGMEHSASRDGTIGWTAAESISQTLHAINFLASRYANHPALLGIELLNEPSAASVPLDILVPFYKQGYEIVRKHSSSAYVIVCQRIGNADPIELYKADIGSHNVVVDLHYYNLFDPYFVTLSPIDNIQFIYKSREPQVQALNAADGPLVFIGNSINFDNVLRFRELLCVLSVGVLPCFLMWFIRFCSGFDSGEWVNEWNVTNGTQSEYQDFGKAQLEVYNAASFGWTYWTLKNDREHWDFEWNIRNNYLQFKEEHFQQPNMAFTRIGMVPSVSNIMTDGIA
ncbi:hypothetical protein V6N13_064726 [Hibiscus sabdariffa]